MTSKVIRSQEEYQGVLSEISALIDRDPTPDSAEGERLNLLAVLVISAESLLGSRDPALLEPSGFEWGKFPINEMIAYGWIKASARDVKTRGEELLRTFFAPLGNPEAVLARYRQTGHVRSGRKVDQWALTAWTAQVLRRAVLLDAPIRYLDGSITLDRMREIAKLSWSEQGPRL